MCVFPVDNKKILLLGGRNPALTHFQSLSTERFIRQTRMAHIKMSLFYSWFSTVSSDPAHFASLHREARSCPSCRGPPQGVSISLPPHTQGIQTLQWGWGGWGPQGSGSWHCWLGLGGAHTTVCWAFHLGVGGGWRDGCCTGERMSWLPLGMNLRKKWETSMASLFVTSRNVVTRKRDW